MERIRLVLRSKFADKVSAKARSRMEDSAEIQPSIYTFPDKEGKTVRVEILDNDKPTMKVTKLENPA